jgi:hypothetical protein
MDDLLPGELAYIFLISILDAALLSWLTLRWYDRAMKKLMRARVMPDSAVPATTSDDVPPHAPVIALSPLRFALFGPDGARPASGVLTRRVVLAYVTGAALYSAVITALMLSNQTPPALLVAWFAEWWINAWPIVPTLIALQVLDWRGSVRVAVGYLIIGSVAMALVTFAGQVIRGSFNSAPLTNIPWLLAGILWTALGPVVLLAISAWRRVRAVTPLALAATLLFGFGSMFFRAVIIKAFDNPVFQNTYLDLSARLSNDVTYYGLFMLVSLPIGWVAWQLLGGLAVSYDRKRFSDVQLIIDCWWVIVTANLIAESLAVKFGFAGIGAGLAAFAAYRIGVGVVLSGQSDAPGPTARRLLLLRVYGYQARTEALFDRVAQRWRFQGPVQLIAGVDLASRAADPDDILTFIKGELADQYVASPDQVPERLGQMDLKRDPDGRFRVNELRCHDDTWQPTLKALLGVSDGVLVDLRSFSQRNSGCRFELEQIVRQIPTDRIVLVYDRTTDLRLLGQVLGEAWAEAQREGLARGGGEVAVVHIERQSWRELATLTRCLLGLGSPVRVLSAAELPSSL